MRKNRTKGPLREAASEGAGLPGVLIDSRKLRRKVSWALQALGLAANMSLQGTRQEQRAPELGRYAHSGGSW